jgi:hypothetical protein
LKERERERERERESIFDKEVIAYHEGVLVANHG